MDMHRLGINIFTHVLDDQEIVLQLIERAFQSEGIENYRLFSDDVLFLEAASENVHIAVIDYLLASTEHTGLDVCKLLLEKNPRCLVIIMSGQTDMDVVVDFMNSGAWKYVKKHGNYVKHITEFINLGIKHISQDLDFYASLLEKYKDKLNVLNPDLDNGPADQ